MLRNLLEQLLKGKIKAEADKAAQDEQEQAILARGSVFENFHASLAYPAVLDLLEKHADKALTQLKLDKRDNWELSIALQTQWAEREQVLRYLETEVLTAIQDKKKILADKDLANEENEWLMTQLPKQSQR